MLGERGDGLGGVWYRNLLRHSKDSARLLVVYSSGGLNKTGSLKLSL